MATITLYNQVGAVNSMIVQHGDRWYRLLVTMTPLAAWWQTRREITAPNPPLPPALGGLYRRPVPARLGADHRGGSVMRQAAASNGKAAVLIGEWGNRWPMLVLLRYAPRTLGSPDRSAEFEALCARAANKLGWVRDECARGGWRKVDEGGGP